MVPSIRPVWKERLICRRCGGEFCPVSGAIPGFVILGKSAAPVEEGDPDADPPTGFSVFEGDHPVCLDCAGLLPGGGVELMSMLEDFRIRWEAEYRRLRRGPGRER